MERKFSSLLWEEKKKLKAILDITPPSLLEDLPHPVLAEISPAVNLQQQPAYQEQPAHQQHPVCQQFPSLSPISDTVPEMLFSLPSTPKHSPSSKTLKKNYFKSQDKVEKNWRKVTKEKCWHGKNEKKN